MLSSWCVMVFFKCLTLSGYSRVQRGAKSSERALEVEIKGSGGGGG